MRSMPRMSWLLGTLGSLLLLQEVLAQAPLPLSSFTVIVANGSGNTRHVTESLVCARDQFSLPLRVETVPWQRYEALIRDHKDQEGQLIGAMAVAQRVLALRQASPNMRICLVGHSSGGRVILAAADSLPPNSVDHIILLAPSVSNSYDLRRALAASREGITSFCSRKDGVLTLAEKFLTTAEGAKTPTAGRFGFLVDPHDPLYSKLYQYAWQPMDAVIGHHGGHFGTTRSIFLSHAVLPLLYTSPFVPSPFNATNP